MSQPEPNDQIHSAVVSDRGLNERRPLNEDSYLVDNARHIFAVADGVGGSEAGEVASKTAIEVLDEAFRHQVDGADIEDLMELAVQRANASIHRMSREHPSFSMMATTIVALHLDGKVATIGHVGDSRLYRLTPEGELIRETEDHSIVEEEVRAGRMTPEQALNHPSKNVISRALGADESVEVDMKRIEVESGTSFLLCSDGITRHNSDAELRALLSAGYDLQTICSELKSRCYDRGAEDNLTAVVVRVGEPAYVPSSLLDMERTLSFDTPHEIPALARTIDFQTTEPAFADTIDKTEDALVPAYRAMAAEPEPQPASDSYAPINIPKSRGGGSGALKGVLVFLLLIVVGAGAFYGGNRFRGQLPFGLTKAADVSAPAPSLSAAEDSSARFARARSDVDRAPADWLKNEAPKLLAQQHVNTALDSTDPSFLYLYGRASLLTGNNEEAAKAFDKSIQSAGKSPASDASAIKREATLGLAAATLESNNDKQRAVDHLHEIVTKPAEANSK